MKKALLPLLLVASHASAQALGPVMQFDAPVRWVSQRQQQAPAVAWTGSDFFVVWHDDRNGVSHDLFGARVSADGRTLARSSEPLLRRPANQTQAAVALGGSLALVAMLDQTSSTCSEVIAVTVNPQTFALSGPPVVLTPAVCVADRPAVAWNPVSSRFLVVWGRHGTGAELRGALFDAMGGLQVPSFLIAAAPNTATAPDVTASGRDFVVSWSDDRAMSGRYATHVNTVLETGAVNMPLVIEASVNSQTDSCIERTPTGHFVAWAEAGAVRAMAIPGGGPSVVLATGSRPSCAMAGDDVIVGYETVGGGRPVIAALRVTDAGVENFGVGHSHGNWGRVVPRVDVGGDVALLVTHGHTTYVGGDDALARAIDLRPDASVFDAGVLLVGTSSAPQDRVGAAFDGSRYLVSWNDYSRFTSYEAIGQFLEPGTGRWLAGDAGLTLSVTSHNLASYSMLAGRPDGGFFLSWGDVGSGGALMGRTVSSTGAMGGWMNLTENTSYVNVHTSVALPSGYATFSVRSDQLRLRRVGFGGQTLQGDTVIGPTAPGNVQLSAAVLDDTALVVFLGGDAGVNVHGLRVDADGGVLDEPQLVLSSAFGSEGDPSVAAGGGQWLAAWTVTLDGGAQGAREVWAARVARDGTVLAPRVALGGGTQPTIGWWGDGFLVVWNQNNDLIGRRVGPDGQPDPGLLMLAATPQVEQRPRLTAGPPGELLLTWEAYVDADPYFSTRAHGRLLSSTGMTSDASVDAGALADGGDDGGPGAGGFDGGDGELDGSVPDGGDLDSGVGSGALDAGDDGGALPGSGVVLDAGADAGIDTVFLTPRRFGVGFGCSSADGAWWLGALALVFARRLRARQ